MSGDERLDESQLNSALNELLELEMLNGPAAGIAHQILEQGINSLSSNQKYVFDKHIIYPIYCEMCGQEIILSERINALDNGGYCSSCSEKL